MKVVLTEKPSVARDLARYLGARSRSDGYFEGGGYQVTWALGHLAMLKEPEDYDPALKRWSLAALPIVPDRFELKLLGDAGARRQFGIVKRLFRAADQLICATDAGREGELIFRYIHQLVGGLTQPVRRLWLSSLTDDAIRDALGRMKPGRDYDPLYDAARCRSEADWIVGLNATRLFTVRHGHGGVLWSVGRVQTPVLALIVRRDDAIRNFTPTPFWELLTRYRDVVFRFVGDRFEKEEAARAMLARVTNHPFVVRAVRSREERVPPPLLYDLTELQRDMNRRFGLSAAATLSAAQQLYERKLITYPRTDCRFLTSDLKPGIPGILRELKAIRAEQIEPLDLEHLHFNARIINDAKVGDHHAIIPTGRIARDLQGAAARVYDAVVTRLIAAFHPPCRREVTTVEGRSNGVDFKATGVRVLERGWTRLDPPPERAKRDTVEPDGSQPQALPAFTAGEQGPHEPQVRAGQTKPPPHFTEHALLGAMETAGRLVEEEQLKEALKEKGLGTPATRAAIIETLLKRGYIVRQKRMLTATDLGRYLIALLQDPSLKSAELTGEWESKLKQIEQGRMARDAFMSQIVAFTESLVRAEDAATVDATRLGACPRCGRDVIEGQRGYGCSGWRDGCSFVLWKQHKGVTLDLEQARRLIQRRILLDPVTLPETTGPVVLCLADDGSLMELQPPERERQGRPGGGTTSRARPRSSGAPDAGPDAGLGTCPSCGRPVLEQSRSFSCSGWRDGCSFAVWKTMAGKRISSRTVQALLKHGRTSALKGFKSKAGRAFAARLVVREGKVVFDFEGR